jgi:nucleotide-binding universal stress UspA family protein
MSAPGRRGHRIVVAVDNTPSGTAALQWAATRAVANGEALSVVGVHEDGWAPRQSRSDPEDRLVEARARFFALVCGRLGDVPQQTEVTVSMRPGPLVTALSESAVDAAMLVVGEPRSPAHTGLPEQLNLRCGCPVAVVDEDGHARALARPPARAG